MVTRGNSSLVQSSRARWTYANLILALPWLAFLPWAGCRQDEPTPLTSRIVLRSTQFLEEPVVATGGYMFKPTLRFAAGNRDNVVGFRMVVDAATDELKVQIGGRAANRSSLLTRVDPPDVPFDDFSQALQAAGAAQASLLVDGGGFFWVEPAGQGTYEVSVAVAGLEVDPFWSVRVSTLVIGDVLISGVSFILVEDFFHLVVLGDSVQWGNGLTERDKMSTLVSEVLESELGKGVVFQRYALSGATIYEREGDGICEFNCFGEVPKANTAILNQVDQVQRPDLVDLVIVDGCINDVNVANIVNPSKSPVEIAEMTESFCNEGMTLLLQKIRAVMPDAAVVVTGYYQIVSPLSDVLGLNAWLQSLGEPPSELEEALVPVVTANSIAFLDTAHAALRSAIATVIAETPGAGPIGFADPQYGVANAVFAPDAWLWGMTNDTSLLETLQINLDLAPMDDILAKRVERCLEDQYGVTPLIVCLYASVGHPTPAGAQAFATAIVGQLREIGVLPALPP